MSQQSLQPDYQQQVQSQVHQIFDTPLERYCNYNQDEVRFLNMLQDARNSLLKQQRDPSGVHYINQIKQRYDSYIQEDDDEDNSAFWNYNSDSSSCADEYDIQGQVIAATQTIEIESKDEQDLEIDDHEIDYTIEYIRNDNNLEYKFNEKSQDIVNIGRVEQYPPNLDETITAGAFSEEKNNYTNGSLDGDQVSNIINIFHNYDEIIIPHDDSAVTILFSNCKHIVTDNVCTISTISSINFIEDHITDVYQGNDKVKIIKSRNLQWYILVPIKYEDGTTVTTRVFADPGANSACVNTDWALNNFPNMIARNKIKKVMLTPGGPISPKYCLWMSFPTKTGTILKSRMHLVNKLPVDVLADINVLRAFGYEFKEEKPPIFRHDPKAELELELKTDHEFLSNRSDDANWFEVFKRNKKNQLKIDNNRNTLNANQRVHVYDKLYSVNTILYDNNRDKINDKSRIEKGLVEIENNLTEVEDISVNVIRKVETEKILNAENVDLTKLERIDDNIKSINHVRNCFNGVEKNKKANIYRKCMFLMPKNSYQATQAEINEAQRIFVNERLKFNDFSYLKRYEHIYGKQFAGLYEAVMKWLNRYKDLIFAKYTFDRKTMKTEFGRLGILPEHRDKVMFAAQYPINATKRLHMINYTLINEKNGFWYKVDRSMHCIPYVMVPKKKNGVIVRYRPAFDGRVVNQWCYLMQSAMPTLQDFKNLHELRGLTTMADVKNCFDCIPLHPLDRKYAVSSTPIGMYMMTCLTYGWKNAAPEAQKRMNRLAIFVTNCLVYIDDIAIKHIFAEGTAGVIRQLTRLAIYCIKHNIQLNPSKFWPACDRSESFGFEYSMIGRLISESYMKKMLAVAKPFSKSDARSFDGLVNYMNNHIYKCKLLTYWIKMLEEEIQPNTKKKRLKWTKNANLAWAQIRFLMAHRPLLHHPTRDGKFAIVVDACNYGIGAALWQLQFDKDEDMYNWLLCDLWSKVMPMQLRHCHSMIHEAFGIVATIEHWQFYLICRDFIVSTDNMPVANIFGTLWKELSPLTQKQLLRLRNKINSFSFSSYHIEGLKNHIADALSRFTVQLINFDQTRAKEDREYPDVALEAITSEDTNTPKLTKKEIEIAKTAKLESERLTAKLNYLRSTTITYPINPKSEKVITTPSSINLTQGRDKHSPIITNYLDYRNQINRDWNDWTEEHIKNANYLEKDKLEHYIRESKKVLLLRKEDEFGEEAEALTDELFNIICLFHDLDNEHFAELAKQVNEEYNQHLEEMKIINIIVNQPEMINAIDEDYDYYEDIEENDSDIKDDNTEEMQQRSRIVTRAMKRRIEERKASEREDDDEIDFSRINTEFDNIRYEMDSHEDFMQTIFGYRDDMDIMNFRTYREIQESDNVIAAAIRLFKTNNSDDWNLEDLELLEKWDKPLLDKLVNNELLIQNEILHVRDWDPIIEDDATKVVIPFVLRGKIMDYAHHNLLQHHFSNKYTYSVLVQRYWWGTMKKDVKVFCDQCISCQFVKGSKRTRTPLVQRPQPQPREHLFADFLGPIYGRYYILVLVDYATGYSMLVPTIGCDAYTVAHAIIDNWIRIFGFFKTLETDWGSGFNNQLIEYLQQLLGFKHEIAEPRNHRSIGKVERVIGFLQTVINHYNLLLEKQFTDDIDDLLNSWNRIKMLTPFVQLAFNQRILRISGISPNMAMFGINMNDKLDISRMKSLIGNYSRNVKIDKRDYELLRDVQESIQHMEEISRTNWIKHTWLSAQSYNKRHNITTAKIAINKSKFKPMTEVLYFVGDKQVAMRKWKEKWTGPWLVEKHLNDTTTIITDPHTGNQKRVSLDRLKEFKRNEMLKYEDVIKDNEDYYKYQRQLLKTLSNYNVKLRKKDAKLDYTASNDNNNSGT